ncbi:MAG: hypothetical protein ACQESR_11000 [Planctomycetota bacterium]
MERSPTQAVLPLVGLAANNIIPTGILYHPLRKSSRIGLNVAWVAAREPRGYNFMFQAVGFFRVERGPTQVVLPLVGLSAENVIRDQYKQA